MLENIFSELSSHMIRGLMMHQQLSQYFRFLGMDECADEHEQQHIDESKCFDKLNKAYIQYTDKLIKTKAVENPNIIPMSWYDASRFDVDPGTKANGYKSALTKWRDWETDTLALYQKAYTDLLGMGEIVLAKHVDDLICEVSHELNEIKHKFFKMV